MGVFHWRRPCSVGAGPLPVMVSRVRSGVNLSTRRRWRLHPLRAVAQSLRVGLVRRFDLLAPSGRAGADESDPGAEARSLLEALSNHVATRAGTGYHQYELHRLNRSWEMIASYRDKRTRDFAAGERVHAFSGIERAARLKLDRLEAAASLKDLADLPGNRLEALKGGRVGQYGMRIDRQWRLCFEWRRQESGPTNVEVVGPADRQE